MMQKKQFDRFCVSRKSDWNDARFVLNNDIEALCKDPYLKNLCLPVLKNHGNQVLRLSKKVNLEMGCTPKKPINELLIAFPKQGTLLDAPDLSEYYYDHIIAAHGTMITIGLGKRVYTICKETKKTNIILDESVTAVEFIKSDVVICGSLNGHLIIIDLENNKQQIINQKDSTGGVPNKILQNEATTYAGFSNFGIITQNDIRINNAYSSLAHKKNNSELQVLNLAYKNMKLASSFSDGTVKVWDVRKFNKNYAEFKENGDSARGLQFFTNNRLISGAVSGSINFYSLDQQKKSGSITTDSEVTDIHLNQSKDEMIITHGESRKDISTSKNTCQLWKANSDDINFELQAQTENEASPILFSACTTYKNTFFYANAELIRSHENIFSTLPPKKEPFEFDIR